MIKEAKIQLRKIFADPAFTLFWTQNDERTYETTEKDVYPPFGTHNDERTYNTS